jgi:histidine triad (HIT) family protein
MYNCIFCKIINREIPSSIVYEDDKVIAFKDIEPAAPVHILIVPKFHVANVEALDEKSMEYVVAVHYAAQKVAKLMGINEKGYRLITNSGEESGQTVMHLHYHLIGGMSLGAKIY